jgi:DNA-directed RNA polymerase beta' subunit
MDNNDEIQEIRRKVNFNISYPNNPEYYYKSEIEIIDFDAECKKDLESGDGFIISAPKPTNKKDIKNPDGIYSPKFGQKIGDQNPFADRYSCECGFLKGRINHSLTCPQCKTKCKYIDDRMDIFGWIVLKEPYHIIHPKFYETLNYIFGSSNFNTERKRIKGTKLENMLNYSPEVDVGGFISECQFKPDKEPFYGIGMMAFYERFDEILEYYHNLNPKKQDYFDEIQKYRDIVFCHSIPVFTTHLRPADIRDGSMYFEPSNAMYNMINKHVHMINNDKRKLNKDIVTKNHQLYKVQMKYMELVNSILDLLSGKKGQIRGLFGSRFNFSERSVIRQDATLRCDQIILPYVGLVICLQQKIINILIRTYNISPSEAYDIWKRAVAKKDERVCEILDAIINSYPEGLPVIINRNPTINYGSILQMHCIGYNDTLTMSVPLQVLKSLAADFDGDVLNILFIINNAFYQRAYVVFNPRNAMYISKIDGKLNSDMLVQRDTIINANTFMYLGRNNYTEDNLNTIKNIKEKQKKYYLQDEI